jgi:hypothetical protein
MHPLTRWGWRRTEPGIEYTCDRVKQALGLHTERGETLCEAIGQWPANLFGCSHMLGGFANVGPTKVTR